MPNASATQNIDLTSDSTARQEYYAHSATQKIAVLSSKSTARQEYYAHGTVSFPSTSTVGVSGLVPGFRGGGRVVLSTVSNVAVVSPDLITQGLFQPSNFGFQAVLQGPPLGIQVPMNSMGLNTGIQPSGSVVSMLIPSHYFPHIVMGIKSTQGGALNIQRYIDVAGTIAQGAVLTVALSANTAALIDDVDGKGFGSFTITVTNTGASVATLSAMVLLLLAK